jgi:type I restriction-modification system DNA methylase subunit
MAEDAFDKYLRKMNELVEGFRINLRGLRDEQTPEAVIRQEYIDPFWTLLGWDVANSAHRSSAEKDVVIEATVGTVEEEQTRSRRPDYIFRIDGFPRFIVEAKKPAIDIERNKDAIFQAKTYAWNAQIPFVILTNFEQFRLFDATVKPYHAEPDRGLISDFDLRFEDYINQWDILRNTFGRESVANGSLEQLLAKIKHVQKGRRIRGIDGLLIDLRGTELVDRVFLQHLEDFRVRFARALYKENRNNFPEANTHHGAARLTEATQRLIDRLVFIRVCEDRDITPYGELRDILNSCSKNRLDLYSEITTKFRRFDEEYNGYLFKPHFSEQLQVPPELLADFIRSLYPPDGAYRFEAIGDDLLGIIYERFLGSTITVNQNNVEAEPKPEVRHAGGVYYTPRFVVNTIIRRVVGPKIKDKSPIEVLNTKILDPACGSGSFLIATLQFLFDHCVQYISEHPEAAEIPASPRAKEKKVKIAFKDNEDNWHLSPKFRSQLLASCIYGVDIDAQAVEVTIMSLYLKLLEGRLPPNWQREFLQSRLLPPLDNNICCGNSLLSQTDFDKYWDDKFGSLFGGNEDLRFRINAFDWNSQTRGFGRLFDEHDGFDCIIGNPPYIRVQELKKWEPEECEFYKAQYKSAAKGNYDIYVVFIERGLQLLAPDGLLGFICPHKFWQAAYGKGIRKTIAKGNHLVSIIDFTDQQVFRGSTTYTAIHIFSKSPASKSLDYARISELTDGDAQCRAIDSMSSGGYSRFTAVQPKDIEPWVFVDNKKYQWIEKIRQDHPLLGKITYKIAQGLVTSADSVYFLEKHKQFYSNETNKDYELENEIIHPLLKGSVHVKRWIAEPTNLFVIFPYEKTSNGWQLIKTAKFESLYPQTWSYLLENKQRLCNRESGRMKERSDWYGYIYPKNLEVMTLPKILVPSIGTQAQYCLDCKGELFFVGSGGGGGGGYAIVPSIDIDLYYLCGLLNSKLLDTFLKTVTTRFHSGWYAYSKLYLEQIPIKLPSTSKDRKLAGQISSCVEKIIKTKNKVQNNKLGDRERERFEREIEANESRIDELVCELYGVDKIPS